MKVGGAEGSVVSGPHIVSNSETLLGSGFVDFEVRRSQRLAYGEILPPFSQLCEFGGRITFVGFISLLLLSLFFFFWPCQLACGMLGPPPGIEPRPSAVKVQSFNHWTAREFPFPACEKSMILTLGKCLGQVTGTQQAPSPCGVLMEPPLDTLHAPAHSHPLWF